MAWLVSDKAHRFTGKNWFFTSKPHKKCCSNLKISRYKTHSSTEFHESVRNMLLKEFSLSALCECNVSFSCQIQKPAQRLARPCNCKNASFMFDSALFFIKYVMACPSATVPFKLNPCFHLRISLLKHKVFMFWHSQSGRSTQKDLQRQSHLFVTLTISRSKVLCVQCCVVLHLTVPVSFV